MTRTAFLFCATLFFFLPLFSLHAQSVGVNTTTPDASAALDVTSTTQGMLVPRLTTAQRTAVSSPATGLLVFDSTTGSFWFYNGAIWTELVASADNLGNHTATANLQLNSHWLSNDGDEEGLRIDNGGKVGIGTANPLHLLDVNGTVNINANRLEFTGTGYGVFIGEDAGLNDVATGVNVNTFVGWRAGKNNTTGGENTAIGATAMLTNTTGNQNVSVGNGALAGNTNGSDNAILGYGAAGRNQTGSANVATGYFALFENTVGGRNTAVGGEAGKNNLGSGNVFLGHRAGQDEAGNDKLYIANTSTTSPLVYGDFSTNLLRVNGSLNINSAYTLPTTAGTANYILQTNGSGMTSWVNPTSLSVAYTETDPQVSATTTNAVPKWNGTTLTDGLIYDSGTNIGIGTTSPTNKLEVIGTTKTTNLQITSGAANNYILQSDGTGLGTWVNPLTLSNGNWTTSGSNQYSALSGNVGIGTTSPINKLDVQSSSSLTASVQSSGNSAYLKTSTPSGSEGGLSFATYASGSTSTRWLFGKSNGSESGSNVGSDFFINRYSDAGTFLSQPFRIARSTGYVGIGGASGATALEVNGTTKTTNFQMTSGSTSGYVLQSDASGNGTWVNQATLAPSSIRDADADTKIQVEKTTDEDKIRFDMNGTEYLVLDAGHIYTKNNGFSVFIGENAGAADDLVDNYNVAVGYSAMDVNTSGGANVAIGKDAMGANTTGSLNVAIGRTSLFKNVTGSINSAFGADALYNNTGNYNTGLGYATLFNNTSGASNVAAGANALSGNTTGSNNTALGTAAGHDATGSNNVFLGNETGYNETGSNKLYIDNSNTSSPLIWGDFSSNYVNINGNLGVGTTAPTQAKLVVNGSVNNNFGSYGYLNGSGNTGSHSAGANDFSIYASDRIAATEFNAFSDARIKKIQGISNSHTDLQTLLGIQITDYKLKDSISKGNNFYKKVIAQQVEKVYPQAVSIITDVVPDIYQLAEIKDGYIALTNNTLQAGDKVKLIFGERTELVAVLASNAKGFKVNLPDQGQVFVYGREVSDFHTVDYEALSMLNISATQELVKMINHQSEAIQVLEANNQTMQLHNISMQSDLELIKATLHLNTINKPSAE